MKPSKLIKRLNKLLKSGETESRQQELTQTLKKLKKKSLDLEQRIESCEEESSKQKLQEKLAILQSQRRKGIKILKQIKGENS